MIRNRLLSVLAFACCSLPMPAFAGRSIQIDVNTSQICSNSDTSCTTVSLSNIGVSGAVGSVFASNQGIISLGSPIASSNATLSVAQSDNTFVVGSGSHAIFTGDPTTDYTIDYISYYAPGTDITTGLPLFQYQFCNAQNPSCSMGQGSGLLRVDFSYFSSNSAPAGANIGYNIGGSSNYVQNANGLKLGQQATDSTFTFFLDNNPNAILNSLVFNPVGLSAVPGVPEPGTWAMFLVGFIIIGAKIRNKSSGSAALQRMNDIA